MEQKALVRYFEYRDFDQISEWYMARDQKMPHKSLFPSIGVIVDDVAAGFLIRTDTSSAIIDGYISNPKSYPNTRSDALDEITRALIECAKFHGIKYLKCDSQSEAIKKRATDHGFKSAGTYEVLTLEI